MHLVIGLGNPGPEHANDRHNAGFMAVDEIVRRYSFGPARRRFQSDVFEGIVGGEKLLALKPITFMNRSGDAVGQAVRFYKLEPEQVIVIHDEIDLAPGKLRAKTGGGIAGHNGLASIAQHIGRDFRRVRIGVGHPGDRDRVTSHVLNGFSKADKQWLDPLIDAIADALPLLVGGDESGFMTRVALLINPPEKKKATAAEDGAPKPPAGGGDGI